MKGRLTHEHNNYDSLLPQIQSPTSSTKTHDKHIDLCTKSLPKANTSNSNSSANPESNYIIYKLHLPVPALNHSQKPTPPTPR
uniref:Uncharacterized protein n=1 Tax=Oryza meridionalis TaxID=40149 RepID=A0A0E0EC34_9ORYZ